MIFYIFAVEAETRYFETLANGRFEVQTVLPHATCSGFVYFP
jgi:hypothetical protein